MCSHVPMEIFRLRPLCRGSSPNFMCSHVPNFMCSHGNISPQAVMSRDLLQFYMFPCSHGNISFHKTGKKLGNKKRVVFTEGEVLVLMCSPEVREQPWTHALSCPSLKRTHSYGTTFHPIYNQLPPCISPTLEGQKGSRGSIKGASKSFGGRMVCTIALQEMENNSWESKSSTVHTLTLGMKS